MDPNTLRARVTAYIRSHIEWGTWERCRLAEAAEKDTIKSIVGQMIISRQATK
jgi:hypothetical protein